MSHWKRIRGAEKGKELQPNLADAMPCEFRATPKRLYEELGLKSCRHALTIRATDTNTVAKIQIQIQIQKQTHYRYR